MSRFFGEYNDLVLVRNINHMGVTKHLATTKKCFKLISYTQVIHKTVHMIKSREIEHFQEICHDKKNCIYKVELGEMLTGEGFTKLN